MEEEKNQRELFEFEKPKRTFPKLSGLLPKADFEGRIMITLTLEKIIFIAIGIIMLMVAIYAFGIERGRTLDNKITIRTAAQPPALSQAQAQLQPAKVPQFLSVEPVASAKAGLQAKQQAASAAAEGAKPYTIVAVTLLSSQTAADEASRFKSEGFGAFVIKSGQYFQVCIGNYASREAARSALPSVRQRYKDAYIRSR